MIAKRQVVHSLSIDFYIELQYCHSIWTLSWHILFEFYIQFSSEFVTYVPSETTISVLELFINPYMLPRKSVHSLNCKPYIIYI